MTTIFSLNDDCWRLVLDYVSVEDIMLSECVSRQWRDVVHRYFQNVKLCLKSEYGFLEQWRRGREIALNKPKLRCFEDTKEQKDTESDDPRWTEIVRKWGDSIVACKCSTAKNLEELVKYCPNLEELMLFDVNTYQTKSQSMKFDHLRRISFRYCHCLPDHVISQFLNNTALEELECMGTSETTTTGACLADLKSDLRSITIEKNLQFDIDHLLNCERLSKLTKLDLSYNDSKVMKYIHLLLEKTPKLEYLRLDMYRKTDIDEEKVLASISRLRGLKHVSMKHNHNVRDSWLETLGRCPLEYVDVTRCRGVTGRGLAALCHGAGDTLTEITVGNNCQISGRDLVACMLACPNLKMLKARTAVYLDDETKNMTSSAHLTARIPGDDAEIIQYTDDNEMASVLAPTECDYEDCRTCNDFEVAN